MSIDTLNSLIGTLNKSPLKDHADAIGMVCVLWSKLEMYLDVLFVGLLDTDPETMAAILSNMKMKDKIGAIRSIGHAKKPSDSWYTQLDKILIEVDTVLRLKRNRLVHDYWFVSENTVLQAQMMAKVIKPQSRQTAALYQRVEEITVGEIVALQVMILSATNKLLNVIKSRGHPSSPDKL